MPLLATQATWQGLFLEWRTNEASISNTWHRARTIRYIPPTLSLFHEVSANQNFYCRAAIWSQCTSFLERERARTLGKGKGKEKLSIYFKTSYFTRHSPGCNNVDISRILKTEYLHLPTIHSIRYW